jgi:predicted AAA+ superfamily ATPase
VPEELNTHSAVGYIYVNMVVSEIKKQLFNTKSSSKVYFWRDSENDEFDLIVKLHKLTLVVSSLAVIQLPVYERSSSARVSKPSLKHSTL